MQVWYSNTSIFLLHFEYQVEGKGNGIKTVIVNMVDIAKALYLNMNPYLYVQTGICMQ